VSDQAVDPRGDENGVDWTLSPRFSFAFRDGKVNVFLSLHDVARLNEEDSLHSNDTQHRKERT